ncbi:MAG: hypothetical protein RLZZ293_773 [Pseudomonadota bacterium]
MKKLTVIIPVYNTASYLVRCFDSIVKQTCVDKLSCIIVNDGSTDDSQVIIDRYIANYPELFSVYIKPNGGLSSARNFALPHVQTEYMTFLDSDDWIDAQLYADGLALIDNSTYDFINFNYMEEWQDQSNIIDCSRKCQRSKYFMASFAWNKIFNVKFWHKHQFSFAQGLNYEDLELTPRIIANSSNYAFLANTTSFYHYDCTRSNSITRSKRDTSSLVKVFQNLLAFSQQKSDPDLTKFCATTLFYQLILFGGKPWLSWRIYRTYRNFFTASNIISKPHKFLAILQTYKLDWFLLFIIYILHWCKVDPNRI